MYPALRRFVLACPLLLAGTASPAATLTVTSTADSGPGTLREALTQVTTADTIVLPASAVIQLSTVANEGDNYMGPTALPMIRSSVVIEANGARIEWLGTDDARAFAVSETGNLVLRGAHVKGFRVVGGEGGFEGGGGGMGAGGAIYVRRGHLTVESSTLEGNDATGGEGGRFQGLGNNGGGGGLSGVGGQGNGARCGGGGGGSRGWGGDCGSGGGGGGGTLAHGFNLPRGDGGDTTGCDGGTGGTECGGAGGSCGAAPQPGQCPGGGGGGAGLRSNSEQPVFDGGRGEYGAGGGGGNGLPDSVGGAGGFGGGGGSGTSVGGTGGFGGGGGSGNTSPGLTGSGEFGGNGGTLTGGGGAGLGGAIFNDEGTVVVRNSTLVDNSATGGAAGTPMNPPGAGQTLGIRGAGAGGALFSHGGSVTILNTTISGNRAQDVGGGLHVFEDGGTTTLVLRNTIVANGAADECYVQNTVAASGAGNLILQNHGCPANAASPTDPQLGTLKVNPPGLTPTFAIGAGSPAYDTGDDATCEPVDQRGVARPQVAHCDIGAFEAQAVVARCKDVTVSAGASCSAAASIDDGSHDPAGGSVTLTQSPAGPYGLGTTTVTLTAKNAGGEEATCTGQVTVTDTTGPSITVRPLVRMMDNNHKPRLFRVADLVTSTADNCSAVSSGNVVIHQATSDEPDDAPGSGDGTTKKDVVVASDCKSVSLRQERDGAKNGRVYKVTLKAKDAAGNVGQGIATVTVPLSTSQANAGDSGVAYTVNGCSP